MAKPRHRLINRRAERDLSQQAVADELGVDLTTYQRAERGETLNALRGKRRKLAGILDWPLEEVALALNNHNGHSDSGFALLKGGSIYRDLEAQAPVIYTWHPQIVPGLLQTFEYAIAVLHDDGRAAERVRRQEALTREVQPLKLIAVIDESVLYRPLGGNDMLLGQLHHLLIMGKLPNITIQVLPLNAERQPIATGPLHILGSVRSDHSVVYMEHRTGAIYLDDEDDCETHADEFDDLLELAESPERSSELIQQETNSLESLVQPSGE